MQIKISGCYFFGTTVIGIFIGGVMGNIFYSFLLCTNKRKIDLNFNKSFLDKIEKGIVLLFAVGGGIVGGFIGCN